MALLSRTRFFIVALLDQTQNIRVSCSIEVFLFTCQPILSVYSKARHAHYLSRSELQWCDLFQDIVNNKDHKLAGLLPPRAVHHRNITNACMNDVPVCKADRFKNVYHQPQLQYVKLLNYIQTQLLFISYLIWQIKFIFLDFCRISPTF